MTGPKPLRGSSIIEAMAAEFYDTWFRSGKMLLPWGDLTLGDRHRFIDAMESAVKIVPDRCDLKYGGGFASVVLTEGREAILADHGAAKRSILHGR